MPAAAPAVSCSRCYAHSATGRLRAGGLRLTASVVVHASLRKHRVVLDLRLAERRAVARDQHELCCVIKKKAGSAVPALLRLAALLPATRALAACSTWQRRTFAHTQGLEGRFVAHGHLARLHDESQARVDALNSRLLLLQSKESTGTLSDSRGRGALGSPQAVRAGGPGSWRCWWCQNIGGCRQLRPRSAPCPCPCRPSLLQRPSRPGS